MKLSSLTLTERVRRKFIELAGSCYTAKTDTIRLGCAVSWRREGGKERGEGEGGGRGGREEGVSLSLVAAVLCASVC